MSRFASICFPKGLSVMFQDHGICPCGGDPRGFVMGVVEVGAVARRPVAIASPTSATGRTASSAAGARAIGASGGDSP